MSVFDRSFGDPSGCLGICNHQGSIQSLHQQPRLLEDDLKTAADRQRKQEIDGMLSNALKALTFEEREEQYEILYGVARKIAEEEKFIETSLEQLEHELSQIKAHRL